MPTVVLEVTEAVVEEEEDWLFAPAEAATVGDSVGGTHAEGGCVEGRRVGTAEGEADDRGLAEGALEGWRRGLAEGALEGGATLLLPVALVAAGELAVYGSIVG